jgi:hypothetical protein
MSTRLYFKKEGTVLKRFFRLAFVQEREFCTVCGRMFPRYRLLIYVEGKKNETQEED